MSTFMRQGRECENLHRAELTVLERATHTAEWIRLTEERGLAKAELALPAPKPAQVAQVSDKPKGGRGKKDGLSAATRELGIERTEAQRSIKIDAIAPEAKQAATDAGLADNQSALLKIAAEPKACEIRLRAERKAGQMIATMEKAKGSAQPGAGRRGADGMPSRTVRPLSNLGISHNQSSRWQKLAAIPEETGNAEGDNLKRRGRTEKRPRSCWVCSDGQISARQLCSTAAPVLIPESRNAHGTNVKRACG
jgi:hypothetical protein